MMQRFLAEILDDPSDISVGEIVAFFADRGIGALLFIFGAPMCIPLPMLPGVSIIFSLPLIILGWLQVTGTTKPWLPKALSEKRLSRPFVAKALQVSIPALQKIETFCRPRLPSMLSDLSYRWTGIVTILMAGSIMFPLPFSNFGPAIAIVVMAVGRIMHDGLAILLGAIGGLVYCFVLYYSSYAAAKLAILYILGLFGLPAA